MFIVASKPTMLSVIMLNVVVLSVIMLNVEAPNSIHILSNLKESNAGAVLSNFLLP
jgi:hypothetical protein